MAKNRQMEIDERFFGDVSEHAVCPDHVNDRWLASRVTQLADRDCTFCGATDSAAPLEEVVPFVVAALQRYFDRALDVLPYELLDAAPDGRDALEVFAGSFDEELHEVVAEALDYNDERWTPTEFHWPDVLEAGWARVFALGAAAQPLPARA